MITNSQVLILSLLLLACQTRASEFVEYCQQQLNDHRTIAGEAEHWFFSTEEIRHLSLGDFWQQPWQEVTRNQSNPMPMMLDFHQALKAKGVELLIVPIPAKATIYPEKLNPKFGLNDAQGLQPWIARLQSAGLNVLDLESYFHELRKADPKQKYWCEQDAHFSPSGAQEIAKTIAKQLHSRFEITPEPPSNSKLQRKKPQSLTIRGDLVVRTEWEATAPKESVMIQPVTTEAGRPLKPNIESSILLLGDKIATHWCSANLAPFIATLPACLISSRLKWRNLLILRGRRAEGWSLRD